VPATLMRNIPAGQDRSAGRQPYNVPYVWSISLVAALGGLMFGYDWIVISGAEPFYQRLFDLTTASETGWAMGSALIGCLLGAIVAGGLSDKFGRKRLLILSAMIFAGSSIGTALAGSFEAFNLWRIAGGVAIGMASNLSPMYIAEVAPAAVRGRLVAMNQFTIVIGILLAQTSNYVIAQWGITADHRIVASHAERSNLDRRWVAEQLSWQVPLERRVDFINAFTTVTTAQSIVAFDMPKVKGLLQRFNAQQKYGPIQFDPIAVELAGRGLLPWNVAEGWRWMFGVTAVPAMLFFILMFFVPESPRWLAKNGEPEQARAILTRVGGATHAEQELAGIEATLVGETKRVDFRELLEPRLLRIVVLGATLAFLQQWCAANVIFYYAADIFKAAGYNISSALLNIVYIGAVNLMFTVVAVFSVDRIGRKALMTLGFAGLAVVHALIGASYFAGVSGTPLLVLTLVAIGCYGCTLAPVTWVILSEIFPNRIRGAAMSIAVFTLWTGCFTLTYSFPHLEQWLGHATTFCIYAAICLTGAVFVYRRLPETKGKSLEQLEQELTQ
jgi:MFS family permease